MSKNDTSRYLSLILRHKPEVIGITLDAHGWAKVLWHGTGEKYRESIEKKGLIPKSRLYVHLSADYETAVSVGSRHGRPVVYRVLTEKMIHDGYKFFVSANGVWLTKEVPVKYLEIEE